jgi:hypothetical protein
MKRRTHFWLALHLFILEIFKNALKEVLNTFCLNFNPLDSSSLGLKEVKILTSVAIARFGQPMILSNLSLKVLIVAEFFCLFIYGVPWIDRIACFVTGKTLMDDIRYFQNTSIISTFNKYGFI